MNFYLLLFSFPCTIQNPELKKKSDNFENINLCFTQNKTFFKF